MAKKNSTKPLWTVLLVFICFVTIVFLTQKEVRIDWVQDYQTGLDLAKQQNKPILFAFYKLHTRYTSDMWNNTYNDQTVKDFVEATFIPILIDVTKQPDIAKKYNIDYYPTHYLQAPDSDKLSDPLQGFDPPTAFIRNLKEQLKKLNLLKK
jgi:thioredoxin-related protein